MATTLLKAGLLADGMTDRAHAGQAILITDDRIVAVGAAEKVEKQAPRL